MSVATTTWPEKLDLFGVQITPTTFEEATSAILRAARERRPSVVSCHAVHAIVTAHVNRTLRERVNSFDMITPDGQPVRWALNLLHRTGLRDRVDGPTLTELLCQAAAEEGISVYLYGGRPEVLEKLRANLLGRFENLRIAGWESPPFRPLTPEEDEQMVRRIDASGAGIVFVGLGCPKQDEFAYAHRDRIRAVQVCVGAAFDFLGGAVPRAPTVMQRCGLEWLHRLLQRPGRLWERYLVTNSRFLAMFGSALGKRIRNRTRRTGSDERNNTSLTPVAAPLESGTGSNGGLGTSPAPVSASVGPGSGSNGRLGTSPGKRPLAAETGVPGH